jgi:hypothetical protein
MSRKRLFVKVRGPAGRAACQMTLTINKQQDDLRIFASSEKYF